MDSLQPYDKLLHAIGKVAQAQVVMEREIRNVYMTLVSPTLGVYLASTVRGIERLESDCEIMLRKADIPKEVIDAGTATLRAAKTADDKRHRVVHDWWLNRLDENEEPGTFERLQLVKGSLNSFAVTKHDLSYVQDVESQLIRSTIRLNGLNWALLDTLPFFKAADMSSSMPIEKWIAVLHDRFILLPGGGYRVEDS
jgi:hypothetical protein